MGHYITWQDVAKRYADISKKVDEIEADAQNGYIEDAESEVDGRLAVRYATPFTPTAPAIVRGLAIDLAYYKAVGMQSDKVGPRLYAYINSRFGAIQDGTIILISSNGTVMPGVAKTFSTNAGQRSSFGMDHDTDWSVSSAWQDNFASGRSGD